MTRVLLIFAGPTLWDVEGRIGGNHTLPLAPEGEASIRDAVAGIADEVSAVYTCRANEACEQAAKIVAARFGLRIRNNEHLESMALGLWQGLTREELWFRYPSVQQQWKENPLSVQPPGGETLGEAAARMEQGVGSILSRNRGKTVALTLRPASLQIVKGLLLKEPLETIAAHLHEAVQMERIELS